MRRKAAVDGDGLLGKAERVVAQAARRGVPQAECYLEWGEGLDVELEKGAIASTGAGRGGGGSVRVVVDGRVGFAYFTRLRDAPAAVDRARQASRHSEALGFALPPARKPKRLPGRWDGDVAAMDVAAALGLARAMVEGSRDAAPRSVFSGGGVSVESEWCAIASSEGVSCWDRSTGVSAAASLVQEDGPRSVSASESVASHRLDVDGHAVGAEAGRTLVSMLRPKKPTPGKVDVLLRPEAAAELVADLVVSACVGDEARRGKTVWSDRLGHRVASRRLDIADDSAFPGAVGGVPFDDDGLPTRPLPIVEAGMLRTFLYDAWDAHRHGAASTRSAVRGSFKARPSTGTHHLVVSGRGARGTDKLLAGIDKGYVVESVLGAHTANATTGDFSVTAPNVLRVERGEVVGPVREVAIGGNLPDLLLRLDRVSNEAKQMDGLRVPHLLFSGVQVST